MGPPSLQSSSEDGPLADERRAVESFKKAAVMGLGLAMQTYRDKLGDQQEVLMHLADMLIDTYAATAPSCGRRRPEARSRSTPPVCSSATPACESKRRPGRRSRSWPKAMRCGR